MSNEYLIAIIKGSVGESSLPAIKEGDGPSPPPSFCPSSKNSSVGDFDELDSRKGFAISKRHKFICLFKTELKHLLTRFLFIYVNFFLSYDGSSVAGRANAITIG